MAAAEDLLARRANRPAIAAAGVAAGTDVAYLVIIASEAPPRFGARVAVVASFLALMAAAAAIGGVRPPSRGTAVLLGAASGGLLGAGVLGIFSIGLPLLVAGILACVGWARVLRSAPSRRDALAASVPAAVVAPVVLLLVVVLT